MLAIKPLRRVAGLPSPRQTGAYLVELSFCLIVMLLLICGIVELARVMYVFNTLQEVTRRAAHEAAVTNFRDSAAMDHVRFHAVFRTSAGGLVVGAPVTDRYVQIDYLALVKNATGALILTDVPPALQASCPAHNRQICMADPNDVRCIRLVRARICDPSDTSLCKSVAYSPLMPLVPLSLRLPTSTSIVTAESLGFVQGATPFP